MESYELRISDQLYSINNYKLEYVREKYGCFGNIFKIEIKLFIIHCELCV